MLLLKILLASLGAVVAMQTALSFVRSRAWWVRIFDFPRPQIAVCSLVLLVVFGFVVGGVRRAAPWEQTIFGVLGLAALAQVLLIVPYTPWWPVQVRWAPAQRDPDQRLRLVIANICMGNREAERWIEVVREEKPDVVIVVEVDAWWCDALRVLEPDFPHHVLQPQDNTYGMAVYARRPLGRSQIKHLVERDVPSVFTSLTLASGRVVRCVVLHPRPPRPDIQQDSSLRDAELVKAGMLVREFNSPVIVAGDLNDVAWSHTTHLFQRVARLLDPRIGRGLYATFPARHRFLRFPLDHVFHSKHFALVEIRRLRDIGSDHLPMLIELALCEDDANCPEPPEADADDEEQAIDAIEDAREMEQNETPEERHRRKAADQ